MSRCVHVNGGLQQSLQQTATAMAAGLVSLSMFPALLASRMRMCGLWLLFALGLTALKLLRAGGAITQGASAWVSYVGQELG